MERRKKKRVPNYEVVDVELAHIFYTGSNVKEADAARVAIQLVGHRAIMREVKEGKRL